MTHTESKPESSAAGARPETWSNRSGIEAGEVGQLNTEFRHRGKRSRSRPDERRHFFDRCKGGRRRASHTSCPRGAKTA